MAEEFLQEEENLSEEEEKQYLEQIAPNKNYLYILQPFGLADILCAGGFSYAAQAKKNKRATVLILNEYYKNFGIAYENVANVVYMPAQLLLSAAKYLEKKELYEVDNFIYGYLNPLKSKNFTVADGLNFIDYYRQKVFDIPIDTPLHPPIIAPPAENVKESWNMRYTFDKERTIILAASINPKNEVKIKFWENIVNRLKEKNYIVYSLIENFSDMSVANTRPILANSGELSYIANNVKCFIGSNVGLLAFLAMTSQANILFVSQFPAWIWDIAKIFPNSHCRTFYVAYKFLKPIHEYYEKEGVTIQFEVSHPKINAEKIFNTYEDATEDILSAVEKI